MNETASTMVPYYLTIGDWTWTTSIPAETLIKTERGTRRADELASGEYGELWGKPAQESAHRWIPVQRAYFFSIQIR